jgi:hypothetical protein
MPKKSILVYIIFFISSVSAAYCEEMPESCSGLEKSLISQYNNEAINALKKGDSTKYINLMNELEGKLSADCQLGINKLEPARDSCTKSEKEIVLTYFKDLISAILNGDININLMIRLYENLEQSISHKCLIATYRNQDPRLKKACSSKDFDTIASYAGQILRTAERAMTTLDPTESINLTQEIYTNISDECSSILTQIQLGNQPAGIDRGPGTPQTIKMPEQVIDHGGGTYSVPGVGACGFGGCMAF